MFGVLAPAALALCILAAVPVAVHLLTRQRIQERPFPMLAFLARVEVGRARRSRLRDLLVLILRSIGLLAGALAVAGLVWRGALAGHQGQPAVILLDGSASMRQVVDGATVFSRARAAAGRLVVELDGRPVTLIITGGGAPVSGRGAITSRLAEAEPGYGDGDPAAALASAVTLLKQTGGDCFFITDLARGSMAGVDPQALPSSIALHVVDAGGGGDNRAIIALTAEPGIAVAGRPVTVTARVANYTSSTQNLTIDLRIGAHGQLLPITLGAGAVGQVSSTVTFDTAGAVAVSAELTGPGNDALHDDDRRNGRLEIVPAIATTLVTDDDRYDAVGAVRPLVAALDAAGLTPHVVDSASFLGETLTSSTAPAMLVTVGLHSGPAVAAAIKAHLDRGGAWLQVVTNDADTSLGSVGGAVAPAELGNRVDISDQERGSMAVTQARLDHALLLPFQSRESLLRGIAAYRYRLTPHGAAADAAVLWVYGDGTIALCERPVGAGRWLELNCSPAALDSNLAHGDVLPLILARLPAAMLPTHNDHLTSDAGQSVASSAPLTGEDGRVLPISDGRVLLDHPGLFRAPGGTLQAVGIPALESDLRRLDPALIKVQAASTERIASATTVTPLWPWLLSLVMVALVGESLMAGGLARSRTGMVR